MSNSRTINLTGKVRNLGTLRFLRADLPEDKSSPFATVYYALGTDEQPLGLRLDINKRTFLDVPGVPEVDDQLGEIAPVVADVLSGRAQMQVRPTPQKVDLQADLELDGFFWLPDDDEISQTQGTLKYSPSDKITLTLSRGFSTKQPFANPMTLGKYPLIHAQFTDGGVATLIDCFATSTTFGAGGAGKTKIHVNRCIIGAHAPDPELLQFTGCRLGLTSLEEWLSKTLVDVEHLGGVDDEPLRIVVTYKRPPTITVKIESEQLTLRIHSGFSMKPGHTEFQIKQIVSLQLQGTVEKSVDDWLGISWALQMLFSLFTGEAVGITQESLEVVPEQSPDTIACPLVFAQRVTKAPQHLSPIEMLLPWPAVESRAEHLFDAWFRLFRRAKQAFAAFFEIIFVSETPLELRFLSFISALEIYSRSLADASHANDGVGELLITLSKRLPDNVQQAILGPTNEFVESVLVTRKHLAHGQFADDRRVLSGLPLYNATEKLKALFIAIVLVEIGIPVEEIIAIIARNRQMQWAIDQSVTEAKAT